MEDADAELLKEVLKLALAQGEAWRVAHPELMDAVQAVQEKIRLDRVRLLYYGGVSYGGH